MRKGWFTLGAHSVARPSSLKTSRDTHSAAPDESGLEKIAYRKGWTCSVASEEEPGPSSRCPSG
jgi:hypothetical protein